MKAFTLLLGLLVAGGAAAEPYAVGDSVEPLTLKDQHGDEHAIDASARLVLFSRSKAGSDVLKSALHRWTEDSLAQRNIVYVADIHTIPALIRRGFVIPAMRKASYPILLDKEGELTSRFPSEKDEATLVFLDNFQVERLLFTSSWEEARQAMESVPEAKADLPEALPDAEAEAAAPS